MGTLAISGEPADAALILDDAAPIPLPTAPLAVKAGPHRLRVERDGYEPFQETVEIGVGLTLSRTVSLVPKPALLTITVDQPGAKLAIDGTAAALGAPLRLAHGVHSIAITEANHDTLEQEIDLGPGEKAERRLAMTPATRTWEFYTQPLGAAVYIDGKEIGVTPLYGVKIVSGIHRLRMVLEGYKPVDRDYAFLVDSIGRRTVSTDLQPDPYRVPKTTIKLDGKTDDWAGIPQLAGSTRDPIAKYPATHPSAIYLAMDDRYVYWLMVFADGTPKPANDVNYAVQLYLKGTKWPQHIALKLAPKGTSYKPHLPYGPLDKDQGTSWNDAWNDAGSAADYRIGTDCLEARFSRTALLGKLRRGEAYEAFIGIYPKTKTEWPGVWFDTRPLILE